MKVARLLLIIFAAFFVAGSAQAMQGSAVSGDQRQADRDAIRSHIDKIFQAYIHKDGDVIRATHASEWVGFQSSSKTAIHGIDQYMKDVNGYLQSPVRMTGYKMLEFDVIFYGDVAIIPYVADVGYEYEGNTVNQKLRVLDVYAKPSAPIRRRSCWQRARPSGATSLRTTLRTSQKPFLPN
jgi:ketosteroid isomerase-like protein